MTELVTIPHVSEIQPDLMNARLEAIKTSLCTKGQADFHSTGLTPDSVFTVLSTCAKQGYQVWKSKSKTIGIVEYRISVNESQYLTQYCENVTAGYLNTLKP